MGPEGPVKSDYRRFNLRDLTPGDDYAGMRQAVERHFARVARGEFPLPDVLLIDGGPGQLAAALEALGGSGCRACDHGRRRQGSGSRVRGRSAFSWPVRMRRLYSPRALRPCD